MSEEEQLEFNFKSLNPPILHCPNPECAKPWSIGIKEDKEDVQVVCSNCYTSGPKLSGNGSINDAIDVWNKIKRQSREDYETEEIELTLTEKEIYWLSMEAHNHRTSLNTYINAVLVNAVNCIK